MELVEEVYRLQVMLSRELSEIRKLLIPIALYSKLKLDKELKNG